MLKGIQHVQSADLGAGMSAQDAATPGYKKRSVDTELHDLQRQTFDYFQHETNPVNGLVIEKTAPGWPASVAATGLALACYPVSLERGFMSRMAAVQRTLATLRFFWNSPQAAKAPTTS
jgi:hypothetical protein